MNAALQRIFELPLVGILRGFGHEKLPHILEAIIRGGIRCVEITMNTPSATCQISDAKRLAAGRLTIGAGTVIGLSLFEEAVSAGAEFIVTPVLDADVVAACVRREIPVFPGALSPTEICAASEMGASMVKVFPNPGGPAYIRSLRGPFPEIKLMPTGGVELQTLAAFLKAGANGLGIGSPLFNRDRIEAGDWPWLEQQARAFVNTYRAYTGPDRKSTTPDNRAESV